MNPELFLKLDKVIHEKRRMAIMSLLAATPHMSFTDMKTSLQMTDGNLTSHIRTLQQAGYVAVTKSMNHRRPLTTCSLTESGNKAFTDYIELLEEIVKQTHSNHS